MPPRNPKSGKRWSMYPSHHDDVSRLLEDDDLYFSFREADNFKGCIEEYDTNIMGRFICRNPTCSANGWASKRIPVTIRMYRGAMYNARVYHQRCKRCENPSRPLLDETYSERIAYRLKKWSGIPLAAPRPSSKKSNSPHNSHLCEGCKAGHCKQQGLG